jgi:hypothetical protein
VLTGKRLKAANWPPPHAPHPDSGALAIHASTFNDKKSGFIGIKAKL